MSTLLPLSADLTARLLTAQNPDGGWGYAPGKESRIEPTSWITLALYSYSLSVTTPQPLLDALGWSAGWLTKQQNIDGCFSTENIPFSHWQTSLALLALTSLKRAGDQSSIDRAAAHLIQEQAKRVAHGKLELHGNTPAWGWTTNAFSWVEPTCFALLALERVASVQSLPEWKTRKRQGEEVLWARQCHDGGWNYGNVQDGVEADYALGSFPMTTAIALLTLQAYGQDPRLLHGFSQLASLLESAPSLLSYSFAILAARACAQPFDPWLTALPLHLDKLTAQQNWGYGLALLALQPVSPLSLLPA